MSKPSIEVTSLSIDKTDSDKFEVAFTINGCYEINEVAIVLNNDERTVLAN